MQSIPGSISVTSFSFDKEGIWGGVGEQPFEHHTHPITISYGPISLTPERRIEKLWNDVYIKIKESELQGEKKDGKNTPDITRYMQPLNVVYALIKEHFYYTDKRDTGERYLEHLVRGAYIILEKTKNPTLLKVVCELLHDIVENTDNITPQSLIPLFNNEVFGKKVALSTALLTKKTIKDFISEQENSIHFNQLQEIISFSERKVQQLGEEHKVINTKGFLTRSFKKRAKDGILSQKEKYIFSLYQGLKNKYTKRINQEYFPRFHSRENMMVKAQELNQKMGLKLSLQDLEEVVDAALDAKDADRLDNLNTEGRSSSKKIKKKKEEFNTHFGSRLARDKPEFLVWCDAAITNLDTILEERKNQDIDTVVDTTKSKVTV